jgi:predicted nucleic acid-binding protein
MFLQLLIIKHLQKRRFNLKLYLDSCCFNRPFDDQTQLKIKLESEAKLFIQGNILTGKYTLVWSYILDFENSQNPFEQRKETIRNWREVASVDIYENDQIIKLAEKIATTGIKPKDALHLACAINAECEYFITTDAKILNKNVEGINLIDPIGFIKLQEDDGNDD